LGQHLGTAAQIGDHAARLAQQHDARRNVQACKDRSQKASNRPPRIGEIERRRAEAADAGVTFITSAISALARAWLLSPGREVLLRSHFGANSCAPPPAAACC